MWIGHSAGDKPRADPADSPVHPLASRAPPRWFALTLPAAVAVAAWLPILAVLATIATVVVTGCQVDEAAVHPCMVAGHDIGDALGIGLLLVFVAAPVAIGASVLWVTLWRRQRRSTAC